MPLTKDQETQLKNLEALRSKQLAWLEKNGARPVSYRFLDKTLDQFRDQVIALVKRTVAPLLARIAELESAHAALEVEALKGGAPWQRGTMYAVNDIAQHDGSLWNASRRTCQARHFPTSIFCCRSNAAAMGGTPDDPP